ncbi:DUF2829 domain-containing protein [Pectobacterium parmentieri]|nr:DUF2829 domain-containing protein [Pectobacterium parmentieri]QQA77051.1 DUF2829 domain-containing protein [Pectobacterium parmentieri]
MMNFGQALEAVKSGAKIYREGWNGKGMWLKLVKPPQSAAPHELKYDVNDGDEYQPVKERLLPWIGMKTADDCFVPWLASQTDMLAEDWLAEPV